MTGTAWYSAYGLALSSAIALPELPERPARPGEGADIRVEIGPEAAAQLAEAPAEPAPHAFGSVPAGGLAMPVPETGVYWVRGGAEIRITPAPQADPGALRLFLIGSALGMALHQRGLLVLHGATVARPGGATVLVGDTLAGKSTMAAALGQAGHAVLGDDTMPVWFEAGGLHLRPGSRRFKLWSDTVAHAGLDAAALEPVRGRLSKYFVPSPFPVAETAPLAEILELVVGPPDQAPRLEPVTGLAALRLVATHTYRPEYLDLLGRRAEHFRQCARVAGAVRAARLIRPWDLDRLGESVALLRAAWGGDGAG